MSRTKGSTNRVSVEDYEYMMGEGRAMAPDVPQPLAHEGDPLLGAVENPRDRPGTLAGSIVTLFLTATGAGLLAVPYSISVVGLVPGMISLFAAALFSGLSLKLLDYSSRRSGLPDPQLHEVALKYYGPRMVTFVNAVMLLFLVGGTIVYFVVVADLVSPVCQSEVSARSALCEPELIMALSAVVVFPICLFRKLHLLQKITTAGVVCLVFLIAVVIARCSESIADNGGAADSASLVDWSAKDWVFVFSIQGLSFCCQFNFAPLVGELRDPTEKRVGVLSWTTIGLASLASAVFGALGYSAFGADTDGNILLNYDDDNDTLLQIARVALAASILFKFPLLVQPMRTAIADFLPENVRKFLEPPPRADQFFPEDNKRSAARSVASGLAHAVETGLCLLLPLAAAALLGSLEVVYSLVGGTSGAFICFLLPSWFAYAAASGLPTPDRTIQGLSIALGVYGVFFMVVSLMAVAQG